MAVKMGLFVVIGLLLFIGTIYVIGKQQNLFGSTIHLKSIFRTVGGIKIGNNVRFSGINIGTIDEIEQITDTTVMLGFMINKSAQKFIKNDAVAGIGSDGLMGDKILNITAGTATNQFVEENSLIRSKKPIEIDDIMISMKTSLENVELITNELFRFTHTINNSDGALSKLISDKDFSINLKSTLRNLQTSSSEFAKFTTNLNEGNGAFSKLMNDEQFGKILDSTLNNLQVGTRGLSENMEAAKHNFLLKNYFKKKKKSEAKKLAEQKKQEALKKN
jgi:phospholipid/cholesterol/gamma-HCH transport system substrate-binding protein